MPPSRRPVEAEEDVYYDELDDGYVDNEPVPDRRQIWIRRLFWVGTALAPIAAVLLVMGQGVNPLRAAAALAIIGVVCIGLSVTLRDNSSTAHAELAEDLQHEVDEVRAELETLRRGVQLTVNRELGRVRGELEAAQQVLHAEATRLPAQSPPASHQGVRTRSHQPAATRANRAVRTRVTGESTGASPIPPQLPSGSVYGDAAHPSRSDRSTGDAYGRRSAARSGGYSDYDPLASTASHPTVSRAASSRRSQPEPHTVEPIRERYAPSQLPAPRDARSQYSEPPGRNYGSSRDDRPRSSRINRSDDVLFGDVLPPQRGGDQSGDWSWATSTSTQDWTPDFDLPSLDGLPAPGYATAGSQDRSGGYRSSDRSSGSQSSRRAGGGRHSAADDNDFWSR